MTHNPSAATACAEQLREFTARVEAGGELSGSEIAEALQELTSREIAEGGPYVNDVGGAADELDVGFNLLVACFLAAHDVQLPNLDAYLDEQLTEDALSSEVCSKKELYELVELYRAHEPSLEEAQESVPVVTYDEAEQRVFDCINERLAARFEGISPECVTIAEQVIAHTVQKNHDKQMSLMAHYMRVALGTKGEVFSDEHIADLGIANIFFWSAFIVYDDFWDEDEAADPRALPVANMFARHYTDFFVGLAPESPEFRSFFHTIMDTLDAANVWETTHCRMSRDDTRITLPSSMPAYGPDFDIKFYPAAGHVFGPVALLVQLGYAVDSEEVATLIAYFKHYLIAMQLNDDAHDWKEDMERGHISTAVSLLLDAWQKAHPDISTIDVVEDMPELERLFWFEVLTPLCEKVHKHTNASRAALQALTCIEDPAPLERYIAHNEHIAQQALNEQKKSEAFLEAFSVK
jgi:hypothetical protein